MKKSRKDNVFSSDNIKRKFPTKALLLNQLSKTPFGMAPGSPLTPGPTDLVSTVQSTRNDTFNSGLSV